MTKYILHGGFDAGKAPIQEDDAFFAEMLKDTPETVKILLVYFAEREEMIELRITQDKESLTKQKGNKIIDFRVAAVESFIEDCKWADLIYLHGGRTVRIMEVVKNFSNLGEVFKDKIIAGDSAGVNVLAHTYFSPNSKIIGEGLKIIPFKTVVHHKKGEPNPLADVEPQIETILLSEYETKTFDLLE